MSYQLVGQRVIDRGLHVWYRLPRGAGYQCVLCGGVTLIPTDSDLPTRFGRLTEEDRARCPQVPFAQRAKEEEPVP